MKRRILVSVETLRKLGEVCKLLTKALALAAAATSITSTLVSRGLYVPAKTSATMAPESRLTKVSCRVAVTVDRPTTSEGDSCEGACEGATRAALEAPTSLR